MKQLRVLVFSAKFGNGHLRAAEAIIEGIQIKEPSAEIIHMDFGNFLNKRINTIIKFFYIEMIKHTPKIWGRLYYKTSKMHPQSYMFRFLNQLGRNGFLKYIQAFEPDLIVCTYPTISSILAQLRIQQSHDVPIITIITDYALHGHWVHSGVDRYIVACSEVKERLMSEGISAQRIQVTGIPVSPKFESHLDRQAIFAKLGLNPALPTFLVMGGAYGVLENIKGICQSLANSLVPVQTIIVCGKSKKLYYSLESLCRSARNHIVRLGYVHNVEELMEVSDLIITKAGGLTVSEALTKHLPLVIFKPIPGQEKENADFVQRIGAGRVATTKKDLEILLNYFLNNPAELKKMRDESAKALPGHAAERAVEEMLLSLKKPFVNSLRCEFILREEKISCLEEIPVKDQNHPGLSEL